MRVQLYFAQSLDGRIAFPGRAAKLSSALGVAHAHRARAQHDAVLVGAETVRVDDPLLTVRAAVGPQPMRVALTTALSVPRASRLVTDTAATSRRLVIGTREHADPDAKAFLEAHGVEVVLVGAEGPHRAALPEALAALAERGVRRLLVEGGARVITSFLAAGLADELCVEIAPVLLGGDATAAVAALAGAPVRLGNAVHEIHEGHVFVRAEIERDA
jgi:5-amino-6-(5-phosphoribosylamino)uracil reductase/diaminohydroxyphosphoribosylaminopyrimidine deaminase/5-amino-6-(5-phosphoribosylamino)uracil reductase